METWIRRAVRQRAYRQLWLWAIATVAISACFLFSPTYWTNFLKGPYAMNAADLAGPRDELKEFISVTGDKVYRTGIQDITTETRNGQKQTSYVTSEYYLLVFDRSRALIVQSKGVPSVNVTGETKPVPGGIVDAIFPKPEEADLKNRVYPFYISTLEDYRSSGYFGLGCAALYLIALFYFGRRALRYAGDPGLHPVVRRVEGWSDAMEVAVMSEREMERSIKFRKGGITITDNFLIMRHCLSFNIFPLQHLLWVYKKVTTKTIYFVVPVARTSEAILVFYGGSVSLPSRKKRVDEVLEYALSRAPWAFVGYSEELRQAFKKDPTGFCAAVEGRRAELRAS